MEADWVEAIATVCSVITAVIAAIIATQAIIEQKVQARASAHLSLLDHQLALVRDVQSAVSRLGQTLMHSYKADFDQRTLETRRIALEIAILTRPARALFGQDAERELVELVALAKTVADSLRPAMPGEYVEFAFDMKTLGAVTEKMGSFVEQVIPELAEGRRLVKEGEPWEATDPLVRPGPLSVRDGRTRD